MKPAFKTAIIESNMNSYSSYTMTLHD